MWKEPHPGTSLEGFDGNHVPDILGHDVSNDKVDLFFRVGGVMAGSFHSVALVELACNGFDLHSPAALAGVQNEVEARAVSPWLRDFESELGRSGEERGLRDFASTLGRVCGEAVWPVRLLNPLLVFP